MHKSVLIPVATIGFLFTLIIASYAVAQTFPAGSATPELQKTNTSDRGQGIGRFQHRGRLRHFFMNQLGLSPEQKQRLRELRFASRERTMQARGTIKNIREQKLTMLKSGAVNQQELLRLDKEYMKYHTQLDLERLRMQRERAALLTSEQAKRLGEFLSRMRDEIREQRHTRRGFGNGFTPNQRF
jgi:Spy/CpxP family protein refolding chaperone